MLLVCPVVTCPLLSCHKPSALSELIHPGKSALLITLPTFAHIQNYPLSQASQMDAQVDPTCLLPPVTRGGLHKWQVEGTCLILVMPFHHLHVLHQLRPAARSHTPSALLACPCGPVPWGLVPCKALLPNHLDGHNPLGCDGELQLRSHDPQFEKVIEAG